jgi:hypothetical protein
MKNARSGGQAQGILMGLPLAPLTAPSQSPVPVGLILLENPNSGIRAGSTSRLLCSIGAAEETESEATRATSESVNFMFDEELFMQAKKVGNGCREYQVERPA